MAIVLNCLGGVRTVTGSMHLLTADRSRILIDAGLFQGRRDEFYAVNGAFPFEPSGLHACVISHAHIDHCGNFPTLVKKGFREKAFLTPPTRALCRHMLPDSGHIQEEDIKYVNKIHRRRGLPPREPLYTRQDAQHALKYLRRLDYHTPQQIARNMTLTLYDSGHILGSSVPVIDIRGRRGNTRFAYAVDLGRPDLPFLHNPEMPKDVDYLIIESTYGARVRPSITNVEEKLRDVVNRTVRRGGRVIIPSFALERTQELLYFLVRLIRRRKIPRVPIYVDSPLAVNVTEVFRRHWGSFDDTTRSMFEQEKELFGDNAITYITDVAESKHLNDLTEPMVIISASGMCEHGRILHHLKNNIENSRNTVLIVGYMARNTLGRKIFQHQDSVNIFGKPHELNAEVVVLDEFSAHADRNALLGYVRACRGRLKQVFIVHGEPDQSEALRKGVKAMDIKAVIPRPGEAFSLAAGSGR